ncbi:MAG: DUF503 domain-containing protein [Deltaproteobacteria bacterium]|nr:DUF503 domain-containing protein [Deltaproteobacteria bacterium]
MTVGIARLTLFLPEARSLKEKRMVLRRVKDRAQQKFNLAIAEVGENDVWQRAVLGVAVLGSGRRFVESALDEVVRFVRDQAEVTNVEREIQTMNDSLADNDLESTSR